MNSDRFETFSRAYTAGRIAAIHADPDAYRRYPGMTLDECAIFGADKMLSAILLNPRGVNYDGDGFKRACKTLGIKYTRKAIFAYLEIV